MNPELNLQLNNDQVATTFHICHKISAKRNVPTSKLLQLNFRCEVTAFVGLGSEFWKNDLTGSTRK